MTMERLDFDPPVSRCIACAGPIARWKSKRAHDIDFHYDRCRRCGFVFVNPRPMLASLARFYETYAGPPQASSLQAPCAGAAQVNLISRLLRLHPRGRTLLDIGSGTGIATAAAHARGLAVTALEVDSASVAATRLLSGVTVVPKLFEDYTPERAFDFVIMSHVLEHAHDPRAFVTKAARVLAPGGVICIGLPNFDSLWRRLFGTRDPYFIPPTHLNHFTPASLARLCRASGLDVLESRDEFDIPRDVFSKRVGVAREFVEAATAVVIQIARVMAESIDAGIFVSLWAQKRA
jgi:SAM-dependent methyltransferase